MDPRSSAQDVHRCDLCETAIVHSYCDFCHVNLCIPCIGRHISDGYDKHKIVPFQERRSTLIYPKCETHPQKNCEFQCEDCGNSFLCSSCISSHRAVQAGFKISCLELLRFLDQPCALAINKASFNSSSLVMTIPPSIVER